MIKKLSLILIATTITLIVFNSCEKGTEPEGTQPGRRDYTWTVDTMQIPGTYLMKMWGSSPTDIWAVGPGGGLDQTIWHFNGSGWETDGISRSINPECIFGFSEMDIWIGGVEGRIWHYDGITWSQNLWYQNSDFERLYFVDIWGESPDDIYAIGLADSSGIRMGLMMHYNGTEWNRVNNKFTKGIFMKIRKANKSSNNYYIWNLIQNSNQDSSKYFEFDGKELKEIYNDMGSAQTLTIVDDEVLFNFNRGTHSYTKNNFDLIIKNSLSKSWDKIYGRNRTDIVWMMSNGLTHFNGTNFEYILEFEKKSLSDGVVFENEVFFMANDFYNNDANNLIYHGTLK